MQDSVHLSLSMGFVSFLSSSLVLNDIFFCRGQSKQRLSQLFVLLEALGSHLILDLIPASCFFLRGRQSLSLFTEWPGSLFLSSVTERDREAGNTPRNTWQWRWKRERETNVLGRKVREEYIGRKENIGCHENQEKRATQWTREAALFSFSLTPRFGEDSIITSERKRWERRMRSKRFRCMTLSQTHPLQ